MKPILALALALLLPAQASAAYNHLDVCEATLRGYFGSDDDIHRLGVNTGATSFGGWGSYWHSNGDVYVYGRFNYPGGITRLYLGHCRGGDLGPDTIG